MTILHDPTNADAAVAQAERQALATETAEQQAQQRFEEVRATLAAHGRGHEATLSPEFRAWMAARASTDDAWGRWALAMDAARG